MSTVVEHSGGGGPTTNRGRFRSAPSDNSSARIPWPPPAVLVEETAAAEAVGEELLPLLEPPENPFCCSEGGTAGGWWYWLEEVGKWIHQRIRHAAIVYSPSPSWERRLLEKIDFLAGYLSRSGPFEPRNRNRISQFYTSTINRLSTNFNVSENTLLIAITSLLVIVSIPIQLLVISFVLGLVIPFYTIFLCIKWFAVVVIRKRKRSTSADTTDQQGDQQYEDRLSLKKLNYFWLCAVLIDLVILIVQLCIIDRNNPIDSSGGSNRGGIIFTSILNHVLPLIVLQASKFYIDNRRRGGHDEQRASSARNGWWSSWWLFEYFLAAYVARYFSTRGFTSLPEYLRPLVGYVACYLAVVAAYNNEERGEKRQEAEGSKSKPSTTFASSSQHHPHILVAVETLAEGTSAAASGGSSSISQLGSSLHCGGRSPPSPLLSSTPTTSRGRFHLSDSEPSVRAMTGAAAGGLGLGLVVGGRTSRRVSLPAGSLLPVKAAQSNLSEARGMLADMLAQKDLPAHLVSGLKAVSGLLVPAGASSQASLVSQFEFLGTLPRVIDSPYIGGNVSLASVESSAQRRQSPAVVWSTTTSATGLPTLDPEPSRARSSSYWKQRHSDENEAGKEAQARQSIDLPSKLIQCSDGTICDLAEIRSDPHLARLKEWSLPIFELYEVTPDTILSRVAYNVFQRSGLFRIFKINKQKFMSFFHALEKGYWDIPYHNRVHATDVLHAVYYFTSNKVPAFSAGGGGLSSLNTPNLSGGGISRKCSWGLESIGERSEDANSIGGDRRSEEPDTEDDLTNACSSSAIDDQSGTLASVLSSLELLGLYTAAAMHDFDHPGRTNAFLVAIQDPKAILYNDRSVLENHHAASAWQLLAKPEHNFVEQLDAAEYKRLRYIVIESILATDLKRHFEILMDFNGKVANGLDWDNEADKFLTSQICIKMADINSPTKPGPLHREWTDRILEEFYAQGDEEKAKGLPVSPYMDRHNTQLARLQDSFIAHLVGPLAMAMNDAGLLPLTTIAAAAVPGGGDSSTGGDPSSLAKSELLVNMEENHKQWKIELGEDPASAVQAVPHVPASDTATGGGRSGAVFSSPVLEIDLEARLHSYLKTGARSCSALVAHFQKKSRKV